MKLRLLVLWFCFGISRILAQSPADITVIVVDIETGEPVAGVEAVYEYADGSSQAVSRSSTDGILILPESEASREDLTGVYLRSPGYLPVFLERDRFSLLPQVLELIPHYSDGIELSVEADRIQASGTYILTTQELLTVPTAGNPVNAIKVLPGVSSLEEALEMDSESIFEPFQYDSHIAPGALSASNGFLATSAGESGRLILNGGDPSWTLYRWRSIRIPRNRHLSAGLPTPPSVIPSGIPVQINLHAGSVPFRYGLSGGGMVHLGISEVLDTQLGESTDSGSRQQLKISLGELSYSQEAEIFGGNRLLFGLQKSLTEFTFFPLMVKQSEARGDSNMPSLRSGPGSASVLVSMNSQNAWIDALAFADYVSLEISRSDSDNNKPHALAGSSLDSFMAAGGGMHAKPSDLLAIELNSSLSWRHLVHREYEWYFGANEKPKEVGSYSGNTYQAEASLVTEWESPEFSFFRDTEAELRFQAGLRYIFARDTRKIVSEPSLNVRTVDGVEESIWNFPDLIPRLDYSDSIAPFERRSADRTEQQNGMLIHSGVHLFSFLYPIIDIEVAAHANLPKFDVLLPAVSLNAMHRIGFLDVSGSFSTAPLRIEVDELNIQLFEDELFKRNRVERDISARSYYASVDTVAVLNRWRLGTTVRAAYYANLSGFSPFLSYVKRSVVRYSDEELVSADSPFAYNERERVSYELRAGRYGLAEVSAMYNARLFAFTTRYALSIIQYRGEGIDWTRANNDFRHNVSLSLSCSPEEGLHFGLNTGILWDRPFTPQRVTGRIAPEEYSPDDTSTRVFGIETLEYNSGSDMHPRSTLDISLGYRKSYRRITADYFMQSVNLAALWNPRFDGEIRRPLEPGLSSEKHENRWYFYGNRALYVGLSLGVRLKF